MEPIVDKVLENRAELASSLSMSPKILTGKSTLTKSQIDQVSILLEQISSTDKMILMMKYQDNLSVQEIQGVFNISLSEVKLRMRRATGNIKKLYQEHYNN